MEKVSSDVLRVLALDLDNKTLFNLCRSSKKLNSSICESKYFWIMKLKKEFPNILIDEVKDFKGLYTYLSKKPKVSYVNLSSYWEEIYGEFIDDLKNELVDEFDLYKGDVIIFNELPERVYIWNGDEFEVDYADDYFTLSPKLNFPEFPPNYWKDLLDFEYSYISKDYLRLEDISKKIPYLVGKYGEKYPFIHEENNDSFLDFLSSSGEDVEYVLFKDYKVYL